MPVLIEERDDTATLTYPTSETQSAEPSWAGFDFPWHEAARGYARFADWLGVLAARDAVRASELFSQIAVRQLQAYQAALEDTVRPHLRSLLAAPSGRQAVFAHTATARSLDVALARATRQLMQLSLLEQNWDSYGAEPVSSVAIDKAYALLQLLQESRVDLLQERIAPYAIAPLANGGVQLEWRGGDRALEVEVGPDGDFGYLSIVEDGDARSFQEEDHVSTSQIVELIAKTLID